MYKNILILLSGTFVAKLIDGLSMIMISRLYSPESIGTLAVFISLCTIAVPFATLQYSVAIPLIRNNILVSNFIFSLFSILLIIVIISFFIFGFYSEELFDYISISPLTNYWYLFPLTIFILGSYDILTHWSTREKNFKQLAGSKVLQSTFSSTIKLYFGFINNISIWLVIGHITGQLIAITVLLKSLLSTLKDNVKKLSLSKMFFLLNYYADIPKYRLFSQVFMIFSMQAPILFFSYNYDIRTTGQLSLTFMVLALPVAILGQTAGQAFYAEIAKLDKKDTYRIKKPAISLIKKLFLITSIPFFLLFFYGEQLFILVFGEEWKTAGEFAEILSIYLLIQLCTLPIVNILNILNKQRFFLSINIRRAVFVIIIFSTTLLLQLDAYSTLLIYSIVLTIHYSLITYSIMRMINVRN